MGLLDWEAPGINEAIMEVFALVTERARLGPRLDHDFMRFVEVLAVEGGVSVGGELFAAATAHPPGDEPAAGDHINHAELFGEAQWVAHHRQRVAQEDDFYLLSDAREN